MYYYESVKQNFICIIAYKLCKHTQIDLTPVYLWIAFLFLMLMKSRQPVFQKERVHLQWKFREKITVALQWNYFYSGKLDISLKEI